MKSFRSIKYSHGVTTKAQDGLKPKDMMLIPQRLALALQADGWWVRSDIIWAKPNPMPESVTDRPTKSHEYIWLLAKSKDYFWDSEAIREPHIDFERGANGTRIGWSDEEREEPGNRRGTALNIDRNGNKRAYNPSGRNARTVWNIATQPYSGAHYATYPEELVLRCLKAATSERGCCPKCGKMWERIIESSGITRERNLKINTDKALAGINETHRLNGKDYVHATIATNSFRPSCACDLPPIPATILDPFCGSGTTLLVAKRMGLSAIGLDLSYQYLRENAWERVGMGQPVMV
jgi:DNA modification methylase